MNPAHAEAVKSIKNAAEFKSFLQPEPMHPSGLEITNIAFYFDLRQKRYRIITEFG